MDFERINAIDGQNIKFTNCKNAKIWKPICATPSEYACNLSHIKALEKIAKGKEQYGIILEDDVILSSNCKYFFTNVNWIPNDTIIIKLDASIKKVVLANEQQLKNPYRLYDLLTNDYIAATYLISKDMANFVIKKLHENKIIIDVFLSNYIDGYAKILKPRQIYPALLMVSTLASDINHPPRSISLSQRIKRLPRELLYKKYWQRLLKTIYA